jgi:hypothetical protein
MITKYEYQFKINQILNDKIKKKKHKKNLGTWA